MGGVFDGLEQVVLGCLARGIMGRGRNMGAPVVSTGVLREAKGVRDA